MPIVVAISLVVNPCSGTWHMPQDMVPFRDSRRSMNSLRPSASWAAADESLVPRLAEISRLFDELSPAAQVTLRGILTTLVEAMESGCSQHVEP